ncbi:MAG: hypothetical protein WBD73_10170 [Candidatus Acidiferrales bacterium]
MKSEDANKKPLQLIPGGKPVHSTPDAPPRDGLKREITQEQLELFAIAARELEAAQEAYGELCCEIRAALLAGYTVEPGAREAQIVSTLSTGRIIPQFKYSRLLVR